MGKHVKGRDYEAERETREILADPDTMAAIAEARSEK